MFGVKAANSQNEWGSANQRANRDQLDIPERGVPRALMNKSANPALGPTNKRGGVRTAPPDASQRRDDERGLTFIAHASWRGELRQRLIDGRWAWGGAGS